MDKKQLKRLVKEIEQQVPTPEEAEGVQMIQYLQKLANRDESTEVALRNWRKFSPHDKEKTRQAYLFFKSRTN
jgi:hypothetical protein